MPHDFFIEGLEVSTPYPNNNYIQAQAITVGLRVKECFYSEHDGYTYIRVPAYIVDYNASSQHTVFRSAETNIYWQNNTQNNIRLTIPAFSYDETITPNSKISTNFDWFELSKYGENSITLTSTLSSFSLSIKGATKSQLPISIESSTTDGTIVGKALDGLDIFKSLTARYDNTVTLTIENT